MEEYKYYDCAKCRNVGSKLCEKCTTPNDYSRPPTYLKSNLTKKEYLVNHPDHYKSETGLEAIDVIEAFTFGLDGIEAVDTGNILKYVCRWSKKNGIEDLKKAKWYLEHLIKHLEKIKDKGE